MFEPINRDIALALAAFAVRAREMRIQRRAVVSLVALFGLQTVAKEGVAARGIDEIIRRPGLLTAVVVFGVHPHPPHRSALRFIEKIHTPDAATFDYLRAQLRRPPKEYFVELGSADLVGQGHGLIPRLGESEFLAPAVTRRDELRAPFLHADVADG